MEMICQLWALDVKPWCRWIEIWVFPKGGLNAFQKRKISCLCRYKNPKFS